MILNKHSIYTQYLDQANKANKKAIKYKLMHYN